MYSFWFIIISTPFRELFINLWLPSGKIVNFIHGKNEFWQKLDFRGIVPCRACDQVMTIPSFKGQAHDMFSRIFRIQIYEFFLSNIMLYRHSSFIKLGLFQLALVWYLKGMQDCTLLTIVLLTIYINTKLLKKWTL